MRYWLSLILGTIVVSFGITWLVMKQGQNIVLAPVVQATGAEEPPEIVFELGPNMRQEANVIEVNAGPTKVGASNHIEVKFKNQGKGPLRLTYLSESCGCAEIQIDGRKLNKDASPVVKQPGESGVIRFAWKAEPRHLSSQPPDSSFRFAFDMDTNEKRFTAALRIEAVSKILPAN